MSKNIKFSELQTTYSVDDTAFIPIVIGENEGEVNRKISVDIFSQSGHTHNQYLTGYTESDPIYESEKGNYSLTGHTHNDLTPLDLFNSHTGNTDLHLTSSENTLLDGITVNYNSINQLSGITGNVQTQIDNKINTDGTNSDINILSFDTSTSHTPTITGSLGWNVEDGTMDLKMIDGVTQQIGEELYFYGKAIEPIANRDVVQIAGVQGNHLTFKKGVPAEIQLYPQKILGVATENIPDQTFGYVLWFGKCHDVFTTGFNLGDNLYFDMTSGTTGGLTNVEPVAPNAIVRIGSVIKLQTGASESGIIGVRPSFGISTHSLNDVHMPIISDGQTLIWNNTNKRFEVGNYATTGHTHSQYITGFTESDPVYESEKGNYSLTGHTHSQYQDTLDSGINIKTINNQSILGPGNLNITVTGATPEEVDPIYESEKHLYSLTGHTHSDYLPLTTVNDEKGISGFIDGDNITVTYNYTGRTITLSGNSINYYWRGVKHTLGNGTTWTSTAHTTTIGTWFLYSSDGVNFNWSQTPWGFSDIQVSNVYYQSTSGSTFALKETHGLMDYESHTILHNNIGTYVVSGGKLTAGSYVENSYTNSGTTPSFDLAIIKDEDVKTTIPSWTKGTYTTMYVSGATSVFNVNSSYPFINTGVTYLEINNPTTGALTSTVANRYANIYQILVPTTSDNGSTKYRMIMLQPQTVYTTLVSAQAEDVRTLSLGSLTTLSPEFVIYSRITYLTANQSNVGKCAIATGGVSYVIGNKNSQVNVAGIVGTNHSALSNLDWVLSGHYGTANTIPAFDGSGNPTEILQSYYLSTTGASATYATLTQLGDINTILDSINGQVI